MLCRLPPRSTLLRLATGAALGALSACATSTNPALPTDLVAARVRLLDGQTLNLGGLRGKVVLVTLINTWADPALIEVPRLKRLHEVYGARGLEIVAIGLDDNPLAVEVFAETFQIPYRVGVPFDRAEIIGPRGPFGPIGIIPTSVLLDRAGRIAVRSDGTWPPEALKEAVESLLDD